MKFIITNSVRFFECGGAFTSAFYTHCKNRPSCASCNCHLFKIYKDGNGVNGALVKGGKYVIFLTETIEN